jgi:hypothetical protein
VAVSEAMENIITCIMMSSAIVKFSGQGGWDETGKLEVNNLERHVDLAFKNRAGWKTAKNS